MGRKAFATTQAITDAIPSLMNALKQQIANHEAKMLAADAWDTSPAKAAAFIACDGEVSFAQRKLVERAVRQELGATRIIQVTTSKTFGKNLIDVVVTL